MTPLERRISGPAARLGLTPRQYLDHLDAGEKWCWVHRCWEPVENFHDVSDNKNPCMVAARRLCLAAYYKRKDNWR